MVSARVAALAFVAAAFAQDNGGETIPVVCPPYGSPYLMIGPGCAIPCFSHGYGNLVTLVGNITATYPNTPTYTVPYTNSTIQGQVSTPWFVQQANMVSAACPTSPIIMVGHSLGGIIVMNTLCGGGFPYTTNLVAAVTYGEETYVGNQPYDSGTCTSNAPNFTRQATAGCQKWTPVLHDYCLADDAKCCSTGTSIAIHQEYAMYYDVQAFAFIKAQMAAFFAKMSTSSSTTVAPSTSSVASSAQSTSTLTTTVGTTSYSTISVSSATGSASVPFGNSSTPAVSSTTTVPASVSESTPATTPVAPVTTPESATPTTITTVIPISFTSVVGGSTIVISASLTTAVPGIVVSSSFQETYPYPNVPLTAIAESYSGAAQSSYLADVTSASLAAASAASAKSTPVEVSTATSSVVKLTPSAEGAPSTSGAAGAGVGAASSTQGVAKVSTTTSAGVLPVYTGAASQLSMPVSLCVAIAALMFFQA